MNWPALDPDTWNPAPGNAIKCGNRTDLPKYQRRHSWLDAGTDVRHRIMSSEFKDSQVLICANCGTDKAAK